MLYSKLFPKTLRQSPSDETSANARLLEQAGFIRKHMAGVYNFMPLGLKTLNKIIQIIREEMDAIGGQELLMSALQPKELWEKTDRWQGLGKEVMYQFKDHSQKELGLAVTHEEVITAIASQMINSYKDLPLYVYQIQTKFRDEPRPRSGLIRGKEFLMKDLYSFDISEEAHNEFYKKCWEAYLKSFKRIGLEVKVVEASGGVFSKEYSHEFQVLTDSGEDTILYCDGDNCGFAQNKEIAQVKAGDKCEKCAGFGHNEVIKESRAIEVGNIFHLGTRFSDALDLTITDEKGNKRGVIMGSYGWGPSRVMATVVEIFHDDKGIIWPESVAPFLVHIVGLDMEDDKVQREAEKVYKLLRSEGVETLFDDRQNLSAGAKFADADLIGIPYRVVVSKKTGEKLEIKKRSQKETKFLKLDELIKILASH